MLEQNQETYKWKELSEFGILHSQILKEVMRIPIENCDLLNEKNAHHLFDNFLVFSLCNYLLLELDLMFLLAS